MLLGGTQSNLARLKSLCHRPIVNGQCRKRWLIDSPFPLHKTHHRGQKDFYGLLNCIMSLVFTFLCATNQARALIFEGALISSKTWSEETRWDLRDWTS